MTTGGRIVEGSAAAPLTMAGGAGLRARRKSLSPTILAWALEPRYMFDGAAAVTVAQQAAGADSAVTDGAVTADPLAAALAAFEAAPPAAGSGLLPEASAPVEVRAADPSQNGGRKEVVFVDTATPDYQELIDGVKAGVEVELIDGGRDGLSQIARWAETHSGYDAIHILAHGSEGALSIGSATVGDSVLTTDVGRAEAAAIGAALTADGDLLVYGCDVAKGEGGQRFVTTLAAETGADVAASNTRVGSARLGGSWELNVDIGSIETASALTAAAMTGYDHVLAHAHAAPDADALALIPEVSAPTELRAADPAQTGGTREVAFIDTALDDYRTLVDGAPAGVGIVLIDGSRSGLAQIAVWAQTHAGYDAIHILSHGAEGELHLGADVLTGDDLSDAEVQAELAAIGHALNAGGDILLYGCDIGQGDAGWNFISSLAAGAGADVAASADRTGSAELGADWTLETATGAIEVAAVSVDSYGDVLALPGTNQAFNTTYKTNNTGANTVDGFTLTTSGTTTFKSTTSSIYFSKGATLVNYTYNNGASTVTATLNSAEVTFTADAVDLGTFDLDTFTIKALLATTNYVVKFTAVSGGVTVTQTAYIAGTTTAAIDIDATKFNDISSFTVSVADVVNSSLQANADFKSMVIADLKVPSTNTAPVLDATKSPALTAQSQADTVTPTGAMGTLVSQLIGTSGAANYSDAQSNPAGIALTAANTTNGTWYYTTDGGSIWNTVGTVTESSALLLKADANTRLYFKTNGSYSGLMTDAVTFRAWDQSAGTAGNKVDASTNGGATAFSTATDTAGLTINTANAAPILDITKSPALTGQSKTDTAVPTGAVGTLVSQLVGTAGIANFSDGDSNPAGIAITATDTSTATGSFWYYTTDGGSTWNAVGTVSASSALLLKADADTRLYFTNNGAYSGTIPSAVTFRAWDQSTGAAGAKVSVASNGGGTAFSSGEDTASLVISAGNTAPTFTSAATTLTVTAGAGATDISSLLTVSDTDSGQVETWTLTSSPSHGSVALSSGAVTKASGGASLAPSSGLTYTPATGYAGTDSFTVSVSDGQSTITKTITVTVTPVAPSAPVLIATAPNDSGTTGDGKTNSNTLKFSGTGAAYGAGATDGSDVVVFISTDANLAGTAGAVPGGAQFTTIKATTTGAWSEAGTGIDASSLPSGTYYVYAYTRSLIGSVSGPVGAALTLVIDRAAPTVSSVTPTLNATNVNTSDNITVTFSEAVVKGSGAIVLYNVTTSSIVETFDAASSSRVTGWNGTTLTIDPTSALAGGNVYSLRIAGTAVLDAAANAFAGIANDTTLKFTTTNTAPTFTTPATVMLTVNKSDTALDISSYLTVSDPDPNQTETWTVGAAPNQGGTLVFTAAALASGGGTLTPGAGSVTYKPNAGFTGTETFTIQVSDGTGTATRSFTVTINAPPTVTASTGSLSYTEQAAATAVDSGIAITDSEANWSGGAFSVAITAGSAASDTLALPTSGSGYMVDTSNGKVYRDGASGTQIGAASVNAGSVTGSTALTITLNASATNADVQALARAVTFANAGTDPASGNRTVTFTVKDGLAGSASVTATRTVAFALKNDAPTLTATAAATPSFAEGSGAGTTLFSAATAGTVESGQTFSKLVLTVSGLADGANEKLTVSGTDVTLTNGTTATTATGSYGVSVSVTGTTATVTISKSGVAAADLQSLITGLAYKNSAANVTAGNRVITLTSAQDSGGTTNSGVDTATVSLASTVNVTAPNHAPTADLTPATPTYTENGAAVSLFSGAAVGIGTGDSSQSIKTLTFTVGTLADGSSEILVVDGTDVALTDGNSRTTAANGYSVAVSVNGSNVATVTVTKTGDYTATAAAALINGVTYKNTSDNPATAGGRTVTLVSVQDSGGTAGGGADTRSVTGGAAAVILTAVNDAPTLTYTATKSVTDNTSYAAVTGVSATDPDAGSGTITVTLSADQGGKIKLTTTTGLTFDSGSNDSSSMTITGSLANINTALGSLTFQTGRTTNGDEIITINVSDGGNTGTGGTQTSGDKTITVTLAANDKPVVAVPTAQSFTTTGAKSITGVSVADTVNNNGTMTATVSATKGAVQLTTATGLNFTTGTNGGSDNTLTFTGTLAEINTALGTLKYTYTGSTSDTDTITVSFTDDHGSPQTGSNTIAVTLTANSAGVVTVPGAQSVRLTAANAVSGISVADSDIHTSVTATVGVTKGTLTVTGATSGDGTGSVTVTGTLAEINTALGTLKYTYTGASTTTDTDTVTVTFSDGGASASLIGGTKTATQQTVTLNVAANAAPSFTGLTTTLAASDNTGVTVDNDMVLADADLGGSDIAKVTISAGQGGLNLTATNLVLVGGALNSGSLTYTGTLSDIQTALRTLEYTATQYYHGADTITITVDDQQTTLIGGKKTVSADIAVTVSHTNLDPTVTLTNARTVEYTEAVSLGAITVADADVGSTVMTVTVSDTAGGKLKIDTAGGVTVTAGANDSTSLTFTGSLAQINAALGTLTYQAATSLVHAGADTVTILVNDGNTTFTGGAGTKSETITVTANKSYSDPVVSRPATWTIGDTVQHSVSDASAVSIATSSGAYASTVSVVVSDSAGGKLAIDTAGVTITAGTNGSSSLTFTGTLAQVNTALGTLKYISVATAAGSETITVAASFVNAIGGTATDTKTVDVTLTANGIPVVTVPTTQSFTDTNQHAITGVSVADTTTISGGTVTATVGANQGNLNLTASGTVTILTNNTGSVTVSGSLADVNATLASLTYTTTATATGTDTITVSLDDGGAGLIGGAKTGAGTIAVTLTGNATPTLTLPVATPSFGNTNANLVSGGYASGALSDHIITIADVGTGTVTATVSNLHGLLTLTATGGATIDSGNGTGSVTLSGALSAVNATLATLTYRTQVAATGVETISVFVSDGNATAIGGAKTVNGSFQVALVGNDIPVVTAPATAIVVGDNRERTVAGFAFADTYGGSTVTATITSVFGLLTLTAADGDSNAGTTVTITGNASGSVTVTGNAADVNATVASFAYRSTSDITADTITVSINDGNTNGVGGAKIGAGTVAVNTAPNDAPVMTAPSGPTYYYTANNIVPAFTFTDTFYGETVTATVSVLHGTVTLAASGSATIVTNNAAQVVVSGSVADINAVLATMRYATTLTASGADTVTVSLDDNNTTGFGGNQVTSKSIAITLIGNDTPPITAPSAQTFATAAGNAIAGFAIADNLNEGAVSATVTDLNGTLAFTAQGGASIVSNGAAAVTISGSVAAVNATLATLVYTTTLTASGADTITLSINDEAGARIGGAKTTSASVGVTLIGNDTPVLTAPSARTFTTAAGNAVTGFVIADSLNDGSVSATVSDLSGTLSFTPSGDASVSNNGSASVTISGSLSAVNATLATLQYTTILTASGSDTITISVSDRSGGRIGGEKSATGSVGVTLTGNDTPVLTVPSAQTFATAAGNAIAGFAIADNLNDGAVTATVSDLSGALSFTAQGGAVLGGNGTGTVTISGSVADVNATLATLAYTTTLTASGADTITVSISDGATTRVGGVKTATGSVAVTLTGNDTPVLTAPSGQTFATAAGNAIAGFAVADNLNGGAVTATVSDLSGALSFTAQGGAVLGGNGTGTVTISGALADVNATLATLAYTTTLTASGADTITVSVSDGATTCVGGAKTATGSVTVTLTGNDTPVLTVGGALSARTATSTAVPGIAISDTLGGAAATVTVSAGQGTVSAGGQSGTSITLTGSISALNAALSGLQYTTTLGAGGADAITITVDDGGAARIGGAKTATASIAVTGAGATSTVTTTTTTTTTTQSPTTTGTPNTSVLLTTPTSSSSVSETGGSTGSTTTTGASYGGAVPSSSVMVGGVSTNANNSDGSRSIGVDGALNASGSGASANRSGNQVLTISNMGGGASGSANASGNQVLTISNMGGSSSGGSGLGGSSLGGGSQGGSGGAFGGFGATGGGFSAGLSTGFSTGLTGTGRNQGAGAGITGGGNISGDNPSPTTEGGQRQDQTPGQAPDQGPDQGPDRDPPATQNQNPGQAPNPGQNQDRTPGNGEEISPANGDAPPSDQQTFLGQEGQRSFAQQLAFISGEFDRDRMTIEQELADFAALFYRDAA